MGAQFAFSAESRENRPGSCKWASDFFGTGDAILNIPAALKYIDTHEWVQVEGNEAVIGLTDHAQAALGDVVYVELPKVGQEVVAKASVGVVESVKAASEIYSPLSGTVTAINHELVTDPSLINSDPYGAAWLYRVRFSHPTEVDLLLDAEAYQAIAE